MFQSLLLTFALTLMGISVSYLFSKKETFLWRIAAGLIIGSCVYASVAFLLANVFGFSRFSLGVAFIICGLPSLMFFRKDFRKNFRDEFRQGKDRNQNAGMKRLRRFAYYAIFLFIFIAFFDRTMIIGADGIFTGGTQNLGDLPFHLGDIYGFLDANNFPPENPSFAYAKFTYPFISDFLTACFARFGAAVDSAMFVQNVSWAFALLVILEGFSARITSSKFAGKIAPVILFFSGGLGFLVFFSNYFYGNTPILEMIFQLPRDYTIDKDFRWGNSLVTLFITQRSLLLGLPASLLTLNTVYRWYREARAPDEVTKPRAFVYLLEPFCVGLFTGLFPLIHAHSLFAIFVVSAFLFFASLKNWKKWFAFAVGVALIASPELLWILSGSATRTSEFIAWYYGWQADGVNIIWFWLKNTGIFIPMVFAGLFFFYNRFGKRNFITAVIYLLPFSFIFIASNVAKFAPWEWDNIKLLIYWFVGLLPFVAFAVAAVWEKGRYFRLIAIALFTILIASGALDVWRVASEQTRFEVFDSDAVKIAADINNATPERALFLNAPTFNSAVVLSGRRSLMRYIGHLSSHGIDYAGRESDVKSIYSGDAAADILIKKYGIDYVMVSPREREYIPVNDAYFSKFPVIAEEGDYRVYKVNQK
ncbi:MAG: hypothetical protein ACK5NT_07140 [Pyrinomonadaceae bacterium]